MLDPARLRQQPLELVDLRAHRQLARLEHGRDLGQLLLADVGPREPDQATAGFRVLIPRDRPREPFVQLDLRLEVEQLAGLVDVRDAQLDVGVVERLEADVDVGAGQPLDPLRRGRRSSRPSGRCRC